MPGPELDCLQTKPCSASSQPEPPLCLWAPGGSGQAGSVCSHLLQPRGVVVSRKLPVAAACCKTYLLEKFMFCKAFPSPGYAKCWPKPQCVPQGYHPTSLPPLAAASASVDHLQFQPLPSPDFSSSPPPQVFPAPKYTSGVTLLLLHLRDAHFGELCGHKRPGSDPLTSSARPSSSFPVLWNS